MDLPDIFDQGGADAAAVAVNDTYFFLHGLFCYPPFPSRFPSRHTPAVK